MSQIADRPNGIILEEFEAQGFGNFPDKLYLISVGGDKYACNCATSVDGEELHGLATFPDPDEATT